MSASTLEHESTSATRIEHPSIDERRATGKNLRKQDARIESRRLEAGPGPRRSGCAVGGAERDSRARPGAGAPRSDDGLAVHLLPGRRQDHGCRPRRDAEGGPHGSALRRRASVELRRVRIARAAAAVRPERLRRDAARPVRVRRQADVGELHDRRAQQRLQQSRGARCHARLGERLPNGDGRVRRDVHHGRVVRPPVRADAHGSDRELQEQRQGQDAEEGDRRGGQEGEKGRREGSHTRQRAGAVETRRAGRRSLPDRQPATRHRAGARAAHDLRSSPRTSCNM